MDQAKPTPGNTRPLRPFFSRYRTVLLLGVTAAGVGLGIRYNAARLRSNEHAQKNSAAPNLYVSVDRSGGGI